MLERADTAEAIGLNPVAPPLYSTSSVHLDPAPVIVSWEVGAFGFHGLWVAKIPQKDY